MFGVGGGERGVVAVGRERRVVEHEDAVAGSLLDLLEGEPLRGVLLDVLDRAQRVFLLFLLFDCVHVGRL